MGDHPWEISRDADPGATGKGPGACTADQRRKVPRTNGGRKIAAEGAI